jgi:hypothetical protein
VVKKRADEKTNKYLSVEVRLVETSHPETPWTRSPKGRDEIVQVQAHIRIRGTVVRYGDGYGYRTLKEYPRGLCVTERFCDSRRPDGSQCSPPHKRLSWRC